MVTLIKASPECWIAGLGTSMTLTSPSPWNVRAFMAAILRGPQRGHWRGRGDRAAPGRNIVLMTLCVARLQPLNQVPSVYRNGSSPCGKAARAMRENHPGFPHISFLPGFQKLLE